MPDVTGLTSAGFRDCTSDEVDYNTVFVGPRNDECKRKLRNFACRFGIE
jgi:hypothetical protein